jgi:hypothetical protein
MAVAVGNQPHKTVLFYSLRHITDSPSSNVKHVQSLARIDAAQQKWGLFGRKFASKVIKELLETGDFLDQVSRHGNQHRQNMLL